MGLGLAIDASLFMVSRYREEMANGLAPDAATLHPTGSAINGTAVDFTDKTITNSNSWYKFPFASPISVTSGTRYAIVLTIRSGYRYWAGVTSPANTGGRAWSSPRCNGACSTWYSTGNAPADFAFEANATTASANSAPTVKANLDPVPVSEGAIPANTGTFSDADGDTVHLTASAGNLQYTPASSGNWTWTGSAADEGQGQTITITADDGHGNMATAQFSTVVGSVLPTAKISGAPASAREGTTIALTASATSPSAEDTAAVFTFTWSVNGIAVPGVSGTSYSLKIDDEGAYVITLIATDDGGFPSPPVTVTINGVDSTPVVAISFTQPWVIVTQQSLTFNGSYTDAGSTVDTSYQPTWTWSDNYPSSSDLVATRTFTAAGTYTATLTVRDDDGVGGSATTTVTVLTTAAALAKMSSLVSSQSGLNAGQKNSLLAKLNAAADSIQRGNTSAACNQLNAFANEVGADQKAGNMTSVDAGNLIDGARLTQRSLGCFRTLVEFLNGL